MNNDFDPNEKWVGMDLDSTLMYHEDEQGHEFGEPILKMADIVHGYLRLGIAVRIFTARAYPWESSTVARFKQEHYETDILPIKAWCKKVFGVELPVTCMKTPHMIELYDDRAIAVEKNTGEIICAHPEMVPYQGREMVSL